MNTRKLNPCPYCGGSAELWLEDGGVYCFCTDCNARGPEVCILDRDKAEKAAVTAWNSLPRHLKWTTETPTEPGWYWWRRCDNIVASMVYVTLESVLRPAPSGNWVVLFPHGKEMDAAELGGQWAGPIPEPRE